MELRQTIPRPINGSLVIEQREGEGEDAPPLFEGHLLEGLLAVFDGLGGAGGATYQTPAGVHSGAYYAARLARQTIHGAYAELIEHLSADVSLHKEFLKNQLQNAFRRKTGELQASPSKLRSSLIRQLPTTTAIALYHIDDQGQSCRCYSIWAGDSRIFALTPTDGLHQLSVDDLKSRGDALHNLINDSPMSNYVNADTDFHLNGGTYSVPLPLVLIAATDGCYGHLYTPQHFEHMLLSTLVSSTSVETWFDKMSGFLRGNLQDDASMVAVCLGWADFESMANEFRQREMYIKSEYVDPIDNLVKRNSEALSKLKREYEEGSAMRHEEMRRDREDRWHRYRNEYEKYASTDLEEKRVNVSVDPENLGRGPSPSVQELLDPVDTDPPETNPGLISTPIEAQMPESGRCREHDVPHVERS